ncbi:hypothetical protein Poli38472_009324 [Pythium oligandrum]|uniref:Uncharacterized protein n=1 Tax=Pythium oligandrum TaxID=41045 RepID=A0A8K1CMN1_PYTOL|nr:hypothetical protein Poli38472_009324 [Pythium oligandrum]|eukprot:TMW65157.1 hypothetical protein Poli38472_009324 [Pythium oligandrum]
MMNPFKQHRGDSDTDLSIDTGDSRVDNNGIRHVAGEQIYGHELYGSLRKGGAVQFISWECAGLCAATFSSVFSFSILQGLTKFLIAREFELSPQAQAQAAVQRLVELPMTLAFLIGIVSDCYPILGLRRKAYMLFGLVINAVATLVMQLFVTTAISVAPVPLIIRYWSEDYYSLPVKFKVRSQIFWKLMQQKAVWRTMGFIAIFGLFLNIKSSDSTDVIRNWAGASKDNLMVVRTIQEVIILAVILTWRYYFMNRPWRTFFCIAPTFQTIPAFAISTLVAMDIARDRYLYRAIISLTTVSEGGTILLNIVPLTEIVQEGSEGSMVGLVLSLQRVISIFVSTNTDGLFRGNNFFDPAQVELDTNHIHWSVLGSLLLNWFLNGLIFLPSQKLDAQQMRMYGGFTKFAASGCVSSVVSSSSTR